MMVAFVSSNAFVTEQAKYVAKLITCKEACTVRHFKLMMDSIAVSNAKQRHRLYMWDAALDCRQKEGRC